MPIYEYSCQQCGHALEVFQGMNDAPLTECRHCHQATLVKLVSAPGFRLKGGGWYETDFKKEGDKKKNIVEGKETKTTSSETNSTTGTAGTTGTTGTTD